MKHRWGTPRRSAAAAVGLALLLASTASATDAPAEEREMADSAYLQVLVPLAAGELEAALAQLIRFETAAAPDASREQVRALARTEIRAARRLAAGGAESLLPVARLHEQAYLSHLAARRLPLAVHSRELAVELIDLYRVGSRRPDADRLAAAVLTSLGGHLQEASIASLAIGLYERAAELAPDDPTPLMGLANIFERQGNYERALPLLERTLRLSPGHREAMLRRGILLLRLDRTALGESYLEQLISQNDEDWILSLAYQESARSRWRTGDYERARDLLLEALERLPDDPSLPVQIAYLTDRTSSGASVEGLATALRVSAAGSQPSPRSIYARVDSEPLRLLRSVLDERTRQHLVYLDDRLDEIVGPRATR